MSTVFDGIADPPGAFDPVPATAAVAKRYVEDLTLALAQIDVSVLTEVVDELVLAMRTGRRVLVAGNGGSSTAAIHIASDLMAAAGTHGGGAQAIALTENIARVTAIANDYSFEEVFSRQLADWGRPGDAVLLLSVSGRSPNLVRAARAGRDIGMTVLAALGDAGDLAALSDRHVVFGRADYGVTEDLHVALGHMTVRALGGGEACRHPAGSQARVDDPAEDGRAARSRRWSR